MMIRLSKPLIAIVALVIALSVIFFLFPMNEKGLDQGLIALILGALILLIVRHPYWGTILVIISLPLTDILPPVPFASSAVSLLGAVTLGAFLVNRLHNRKEALVGSLSLIFGGLFLIWIIATNPDAAFLPSNEDRIWVFTFFQLLLLAWLAAQLFDDPAKHRTLMWFFSGAILISAIFAISQGGIAESAQLSERSAGLAGGANSAARYFVVGLVLIYYLRSTTSNGLLRFILLVCIGIVVLGIFYTVSRTGLLLLVAAVGLILTLRVEGKHQAQVMIVLLLILSVVWLFADNIVGIFATILLSIREGSDTVGLRYKLWEAGWRMWQDHPIQGIGIGQYVERLAYYGSDLLPPRKLRLGAHNMYIQVLAETGLVGLVLFVAMLITSLRLLWKTMHSKNFRISLLAQVWFVVSAVMLLGGLTKHDHYDKLLWITFGLGASLSGKNINSDAGNSRD